MRPTLKVRFDGASSGSGSIQLNGKSIAVTTIDFVARAHGLVECTVGFHPDELEVDLPADCLRLSGVQLPEPVARAFLAHLKKLYPDV